MSLDINAAAVLELERSIWKDMVEDQTSTNKKVPAIYVCDILEYSMTFVIATCLCNFDL